MSDLSSSETEGSKSDFCCGLLWWCCGSSDGVVLAVLTVGSRVWEYVGNERGGSSETTPESVVENSWYEHLVSEGL